MEHEKFQHLPLRMLRKFGCPRITPHRDRGVHPGIFDPEIWEIANFRNKAVDLARAHPAEDL